MHSTSGRPGPLRRASGRRASRHRRPRRRALGAALSLGAALAAPGASGVTGVCPDGSIFIVQRDRDIPCSGAKRVEPHDIPPLKAQYLPRPYGWEQHQRRQDRNNPYNLVDQAPTLERAPAPHRPPVPGPPPGPEPRQAERAGAERHLAVAPTPRRAAPSAPQPAPLLSAEELRDLALLVELSQRQRPAAFEPEPGNPVALRLARSEAFEPRLREIFAVRGGLGPGRVLLFHAGRVAPEGEARFHAQLTFEQGGTVFQPERADPRQIGLLQGVLGDPGRGTLGYVVLPDSFDLTAPLDVYWNDRLLTARLGR